MAKKDENSKERIGERMTIGRRSYKLPGTKAGRITVGFLLVIGGVLGFLPVLGFWMIPLGFMILAKDLYLIRRLNRRIKLWWGRRKRPRKKSEK